MILGKALRVSSSLNSDKPVCLPADQPLMRIRRRNGNARETEREKGPEQRTEIVRGTGIEIGKGIEPRQASVSVRVAVSY